ncbi:HTH_48 domain-containing protein [Sergentomyia squamirostris]
MEVTEIHLRHVMLYQYESGVSAEEATKEICDTYGEDILKLSTCMQWYEKFKSGDYNLNDDETSNGPNGASDGKNIQSSITKRMKKE